MIIPLKADTVFRVHFLLTVILCFRIHFLLTVILCLGYTSYWP